MARHSAGGRRPAKSLADAQVAAASEPAAPADAAHDDVQHASQTEAALDMIRSRIVDMSLQPGSRIDERLLIEQFRLGRTPAREAISRLVAEGFVHIVPQRGGTFVRKLDLDEMGEVVVAHQLAESVLGQMCRFDDPGLLADLGAIQRRYVGVVNRRDFLAITQLNQDFHLRLHRTIGNALFYDFATSTHRHVRRLNVYVYQREQADPEFQAAQFTANLDQHEQIIAAVSRGDRDALSEILPAHAKYTQRRLVRLLENKSAGPVRLDLSGISAE
jgi:DNA-binding GntR family transcriptional regulator